MDVSVGRFLTRWLTTYKLPTKGICNNQIFRCDLELSLNTDGSEKIKI
jgi:hypothetical protein